LWDKSANDGEFEQLTNARSYCLNYEATASRPGVYVMTLVLLKEIAVILVCYAVGCFASGYYWVKWRTGQDIRNLGSGSVGARNVGRVLGPWGFVVTLLADVTKGVIAVALAKASGLRPDAVIAAMMGVVIGHTWPVQLRFHGGKGIATSLGALVVTTLCSYSSWPPFLFPFGFFFAVLR
jgi:acyl-phosphate glycerol 3-phosphate acyltransferase